MTARIHHRLVEASAGASTAPSWPLSVRVFWDMEQLQGKSAVLVRSINETVSYT
jgi:hypothetical protein